MCIMLLLACNNTSSNDSEYAPTEDYVDSYEDSTPNTGVIRLTGKIVQCNKCMGYGMVQKDLYSQPEVCKFCEMSTFMRMQQGWRSFNGRFGQVDAVFNTLPANYFDTMGGDLNGGYYDNGGRSNSDQIESEIEMHEENIARMEGMLEYIDGTILRTQLQQQIIEERHEIKRLKRQLEGM